MPEHEIRRLPIKVVLPQDADLRAPHRGGSPRKVFGEVDATSRKTIVKYIKGVREHFSSVLTPGSTLPAVARIVLKEAALAKSHRPWHLFERSSCPIIGGETFGHLLISVTTTGLDTIERDVHSTESTELIADISTIKRIEPFTAEDAAGTLGVDGLQKLMRSKRNEPVKVRLFRHRNTAADATVFERFSALVASMGLPEPEPLPFSVPIRAYRLHKATTDTIARLAGFVGTQSIQLMPQFNVTAQYVPLGQLSAEKFPAPDPNAGYPVVGLIDSGTDRSNAALQAWIIDRDEDDVPSADQDNSHATFVAGLIINGYYLNHQEPSFPRIQAKIVDVVAVPKGATPLYEDQLLQTIRRVVKKYTQVKVWNLSVSRTDLVCRDDAFSDFGMELDELQRKHGITFVTCAGNYIQPPFRGWPPEDVGERDRIYPPADAALSIAVGSIAHAEKRSSRVRKAEPSPFTRRGPGAAFLPKPEVAHFGGNCDSTGDYRQVGVLSVGSNGQLCEGIGTSFSTPLVSSILANVGTGVRDKVSKNLAKALVIHSAALENGPLDTVTLKYRGFGIPSDLPEILTCAPWQATLVLEPTIPPARRWFAREDFPIPRCFRRPDNTVEGGFLMTLVYDPPLDPNAGAEYCQSNVDVSLGTFDAGDDGKPEHVSKIPLEPRDYSKLYERHLVEWGFKWSPVKVYRKTLEGTSGSRWRLMLRLLYRATRVLPSEPQPCALVVTLFDPDRQKPVYNDVVTAMRTSGWVTQDLRVSDRIRARGTT